MQALENMGLKIDRDNGSLTSPAAGSVSFKVSREVHNLDDTVTSRCVNHVRYNPILSLHMTPAGDFRRFCT